MTLMEKAKERGFVPKCFYRMNINIATYTIFQHDMTALNNSSVCVKQFCLFILMMKDQLKAF